MTTPTNFDNLSGKRVYICEDEGLTVMQLRRALTRAGMVVVGTSLSGDDCIEEVTDSRPDIVLMDIGLRGTNGADATREIMTSCPTCVVMLTGSGGGSLVDEALRNGAAGVISKPVLSDTVLPEMSQLLETFNRKQ